MKILVINTGSSSIKYQLFDLADNKVLAKGLLEKIGESTSLFTQQTPKNRSTFEKKVADHKIGMKIIVDMLTDSKNGAIRDPSEITAVGHRVVHGGESFKKPALINDDVIRAIMENTPLAPLHNPANLVGIEVSREFFPNIPHVAVFDTAFHQTIPPKAFHYGLPYEYYKKHRIRRYGFHGTSHYFVAKEAARILKRPLGELNLITIHLGNGSSITAIEKGESVDTSMGMTPLEGLLMGTRSGDLDPAVWFYLAEYFSMSVAEIESLLNRQSGLKGICGTNDMREILQNKKRGDPLAALALDIYAYRIRKYIGSYLAVLGYADAIVFTAGIGENVPEVRAEACRGLDRLGISLDEEKNSLQDNLRREIQKDGSAAKILVVPTDEELEIALQTMEVVRAAP